MGMDFVYGNILPDEKELWNEKYTKRHIGGYPIDRSDLDEGVVIRKSTPLFTDYKAKKVRPIKNVRVVEAAESSHTTLKIMKDNLVRIGDTLGDGKVMATITAIDRSSKQYDVLTIALGIQVPLNLVLFEVNGFTKVDGTVSVVEAATKTATLVKVGKDSGIVAGDYVGSGNVRQVVEAVTTGEASDELTLGASLGSALAVNAVLNVYKAATVVSPRFFANTINYRPVRALAKETITPVFVAYEIMEDNLPYPVSEIDKKSLGDRFLYI